jgi:AraC-like DNA-binding protein
MQPIFKLQDGGNIPLSFGLPPGYRGFILQGAESFSFQSSSDLIVQQNFQRADFAIRLGIYKFFRIVKSILEPPAFSTGATLTLKQDFKGGIEENGDLFLYSDHFSFIQYAGKELMAEFKEGREYRILDISCSSEIMADTLLHFPDLAGLFEKANSLKKTSLITSPRYAGFQALGLVDTLLKSPFESTVNEIYFEYKIRESLILFLTETSKKNTTEVVFTKEEEVLIFELKSRLEMDSTGKIRIADLSRDFGMNTMRLKILFKKLFGWTIFQYHFQHRMKEALRLLKDPQYNTKMVASMMGYKRVTTFISQFRHYHGFAPGDIQSHP